MYINDIGAFSPTLDHHLQLLDKVCKKLQDNGFTVNTLNCEWRVCVKLASCGLCPSDHSPLKALVY